MSLHVFNPEHDIALGHNLARFTPPHAARALRHDLEYLPVLWAGDGDAVMVGDEQAAQRSVARLKGVLTHFSRYGLRPLRRCVIVGPSILKVTTHRHIMPWGWDVSIKNDLLTCGADPTSLPSDRELDEIRMLSHRRTATRVLPLLRIPGTVGEAYCCAHVEEIVALLSRYKQIVVKAPWSSSGRGIRFVDFGPGKEGALRWAVKVVERQGSVIVEPYYKKALDFGMEFEVSHQSHCTFFGLSLFHTANGAYTGNLLATEAAKRELLSRYLPLSLLDEVCAAVGQQLSRLCIGRYHGPVGVDMMVVQGDGGRGYLLHPCVEINFRRTMGHLSLCLSPCDDELQLVMRVELDHGKYKLKIRQR